MTCTSPLTIVRSDGLHREVPCGQCTSCRKARSSEWATRIIHELPYWNSAAFVTLTYSEDSLPPFNSLSKRDVTTFLKRLRYYYTSQLAYYLAGEYGEKQARPHYHAIVFGIEPCCCSSHIDRNKPCGCHGRDAILQAWQQGRVDRCGTVTTQSALYVADYICKSLTGDYAEQAYTQTGRQAPFATMSKNIGRRFALDNARQLLDNQSLTVNGVQRSMPRYYKKLWTSPNTFWAPEWNPPTPPEVTAKTPLTWIGRLPRSFHDINKSRVQKSRDIDARIALYKKGDCNEQEADRRSQPCN